VIFRTELKAAASSWTFDHTTSISLLGSCFATAIGEKFAKAKIKTLINPWGTIYHPTPLRALIESAITRQTPSDAGYIMLGNRAVHYSAHSDIHGSTKEKLSEQFTFVNEHFLDHVKQSRLLFITLGTAWHFHHTELTMIVANCHKQPNSLFERRISSAEEVKNEIGQIIRLLQEQNPTLQIVLTVSPVRHIRDGLIANNRSKAHLITACHQLCEESTSLHYFPSYELVLDDLRDYRYYGEDLVHPSSQAVDYIWQYLLLHHTLPPTKELVSDAIRISKDVAHRPVEPESEEHRVFLQKLMSKMKRLSDKGVDYSDELIEIRQRLSDLSV